MRRKELREAIEDVSFGLISSAINLSLGLVVFGAITATSARRPSSVAKAVEEATNFQGINRDSLKQAFWKARNRGLLRRRRSKGQSYWSATELGKQRLKSKFPIYHTQRPWDKKLYLITYDIPEDKRRDRDRLRELLINLKARQFQHSVYLMLWDPSQPLKQFIKEYNLEGSVIVSDTGTDGSIGEMDLDQLIWQVFRLENLNNRYELFLKEAKKSQPNPIQLAFHFFSILADDPQLPFELLGPKWKGTKAYEKFAEIAGDKIINFLNSKRPHIS